MQKAVNDIMDIFTSEDMENTPLVSTGYFLASTVYNKHVYNKHVYDIYIIYSTYTSYTCTNQLISIFLLNL